MALRFALSLFVGVAMLGVVACGDDDDDSSGTGSNGGNATASGSPPASQPDYCDELDDMKEDADDLQSAVTGLNRQAAQTAVTDLKSSVQDFRTAIRDGDSGNEQLDQAAGDLSGAVDGLETTLRQATQGDTSLTGIIQELETQLPVIVSSLDEIRQEARCN